MPKLNKDSVFGTFVIIIAFCLVCSVLVSSAVVMLDPFKAAAITTDRQLSILKVAGVTPGKNVSDTYNKYITARLIDMKTGMLTDDASDVAGAYNFASLAKQPDTSIAIPADKDYAGIRTMAQKMPVFYVKDDAGNTTRIILPFYGQALWSTAYGYLALDPDLNHIVAITFYSHGETPGLGGEIDNPRWQALWVGKRLFDDNGEYRFLISKTPDKVGEGKDYEVDSLSGATLTARGVDNAVRFWMDYAYKAFFDNNRTTTEEIN